MIVQIFENENFQLHLQTPDDGGDVGECWFMFGAFGNRGPTGSYFLEQRRAKAVHITTLKDGFYQERDLPEVMEFASAAVRSGRRICFGGSMGAFGAIVAAPMVDADVVIAGAPQTTYDISVLRDNDMRKHVEWEALKNAGLTRPDLADSLEKVRARVYVVFDPLVAQDVWHANRIREFRNVTFVVARGHGHEVFHPIRRSADWRDFIDSLIAGDGGRAQTIAASGWARRRLNRDYHLEVGSRLAVKGRYRMSAAFLRHALKLDASEPAVWFWLSLNAQVAGRHDEAIECALRGCDLVKDDVYHGLFDRLAQSYLAASRIEEAAWAYARGLKAFPNQSMLAFEAAKLFLLLAQQHSETACASQPNVPRYQELKARLAGEVLAS